MLTSAISPRQNRTDYMAIKEYSTFPRTGYSRPDAVQFVISGTTLF